MASNYVILVYDIKPKRVGKIHKICKKYLTWVQNSVFEGEINSSKLKKLMRELARVMNKKEDNIIIYVFKSKKNFYTESVGRSFSPKDENLFMI